MSDNDPRNDFGLMATSFEKTMKTAENSQKQNCPKQQNSGQPSIVMGYNRVPY